jgi:hypothetical protein
VGVILAARWFFYFFTIERCFGAPRARGRLGYMTFGGANSMVYTNTI